MNEPASFNDASKPAEERPTTVDLAVRHEPMNTGVRGATGDQPAAAIGAAAAIYQPEPLFPAQDSIELRARWDGIQASFVDEPRKAVQDADSLVATAMKRLAETFANERSTLETQWDRGDDVSTEDLRVALRRYRSFFGRLLSM